MKPLADLPALTALTALTTLAARLARPLREALERRHARATLRGLDRRTLADIGIDPSEIDSIEAESTSRAGLTRLRVVALAPHHG